VQEKRNTEESQRKQQADAVARKQEEESRRKAMMDNKIREKLMQNKQAMTLCFEADGLMFAGEPDAAKRAVDLYKKSEQLGNPKAMMALGRIYELGIGVDASLEVAIRYYEAAANQN